MKNGPVLPGPVEKGPVVTAAQAVAPVLLTAQTHAVLIRGIMNEMKLAKKTVILRYTVYTIFPFF